MNILERRSKLTPEQLSKRTQERAKRVAKLGRGAIRQRVVVACPQGGFITEVRTIGNR